MKLTKATLILATALAWQPAQAAFFTNGNFETCDLSGWQTDTDGGPANSDDFAIAESDNGCSAVIYADRSDAFVNTLYQPIDFTTDENAQLVLQYDFSVTSAVDDQPPLTADYFTIGFGDGSGLLYNAGGELGSLFGQPDINGLMNYTGDILLDGSFNNQQGWTLEIQLFSNFDFEQASMTINSFSIQATDNQINVPAPATLPLILCAFGLIGRRALQTPAQEASS